MLRVVTNCVRKCIKMSCISGSLAIAIAKVLSSTLRRWVICSPTCVLSVACRIANPPAFFQSLQQWTSSQFCPKVPRRSKTGQCESQFHGLVPDGIEPGQPMVRSTEQYWTSVQHFDSAKTLQTVITVLVFGPHYKSKRPLQPPLTVSSILECDLLVALSLVYGSLLYLDI